MKKTLAILLAFMLVFSSLPVAFAEEAIPADAQACLDLGMLEGAGAGVTNAYLGTSVQRIQAALMFLRLKGLDDDALAFTGTDNFADADKAAWAKPIMAYLKANPELAWNGVGNNSFDPTGLVDATQYYKVMLEALGYKATTADVVGDFAYADTLKFAAEKGLVKVADVKNYTVNDLATATIEALKAAVKGGTKTLAASLVEAKVITQEAAQKAGLVADLKVDSIAANSAKSFEVKFNKAVEDTSKVTFAVTRGTVAASLTTAWNADKTVATLTAAAKLPEATYTVVVKNGDAEMAKQEVTITKEVIKTIEYGSTEIIRATDATGIVRFKVVNQYGEDVTNAALGRGLDFVVSTNKPESVDYKAGVITIQHGVDGDTTTYLNQLKDLKTVVITARDITTGFVQTNTFTVSDTVGVVADIKLLGVVDEKGNAVDFKYDLGKTYYLDYEATDVLGNKITNYSALNATLYSQKILDIKSSNTTYVNVVPEKHPSDSTKMAYRLQFTGTAMDYDTPITFLAVAPFAGKSSNLNVTLYRKARVETFKMQNPAVTATKGKAVEIPFEAYDQAGNPVTLYDDLVDKITFTPNDLGVTASIGFVKQADGTAKLFATLTQKQTYYITSTVKGSLTGSFSQIGIDVKDVAIATTIDPLRHTRAYTTGGAWNSVRVDKFTVRDQFDNAIALRDDAQNTAYSVRVTSSDKNVINITSDGTQIAGLASDNTIGFQISGEQKVNFVGGANAGTATITYELYGPNVNKTGNPVEVLDSATAIVYNFAQRDIKSVDLQVEDKTIYMTNGNTVAGALLASDELYNDINVYGKTDSGMEVRLPSTAIYYALTDAHFTQNASKDVANTAAYANNETTGSTVLTAYYEGSNGVLTDSATINASKAAPVVDSVDVSYDHIALRAGTISVTNDVIEMTEANFNSIYNGGAASSILTYATDGTAAAVSPVTIDVTTQYGAWVAKDIIVTPKTGNAGTVSADDATGKLTATGVKAGDEFTITILADNGKSKVIRFKVK